MTLTRSQVSSERGAFLILAALVIAVLFGFIALAIDASRTLTSMSEKIATADSIALAALDAYLNQEPPPPVGPAPALTEEDRHVYKWNKAKDQVVTFSNANRMTFIDGPQTISLADVNASGKGVTIKPGRWWTERPNSCDDGGAAPACPCTEITAPLNRPCFQECSQTTGCVNPGLAGAGDIFATAMAVTLSTEGAGGIRMMFARIMGVDKLDIEGKAFSAASGSVAFSLPQVHVLLFDLSRAMTMDNYLPFERAQVDPDGVTQRREYSFPLSGIPSMGCTAAGVTSTCKINCPIALSPTTNFTPADAFQLEYKNDPAGLNPALTPAYDDAKYAEYKCYSGNLGGALQRHLVATENSAPLPEPYTTLLHAANKFLTGFKNLGRAGDKIMLLGFDSVDVPEWHFPSEIAGQPIFLDPTAPELDQLILMTSNRDQAAKKMFFPRAYSKLDLTKALKTAGNAILKAYPSPKIDPYITLYSNGFSLCGANNPPSLAKYCAGLTVANANPNDNMKNFEKQTASLDEALVVMGQSYLKPNRIKVNVVSGNATMPTGTAAIPTHNAMIGHWSEDRCATDREFRRKRYLYVIPYPSDPNPPLPQIYRNQMIAEYGNIGRRTASAIPLVAAGVLPDFTDGLRYIQPSKYMYSLAAETLGHYVELRAECPVLNAATANSRCATTRLGGSSPTISTRIAQTRLDAWKAGPPGTMEIDSEGRLLCEPQNAPHSLVDKISDEFIEYVTQSRLITLVMPD